jgi:hypothetical protein
MTITVQAPNGASVQFPEGTDSATINKVMTENFGGADPVADVGKSLLSGAASGATQLAGMVPDIAGLMKGAANKYLFDPLLNATIGPPSKTLSPGQQPVDINRLAGSANIKRGVESVTGEFYKPQTTAGKYAETVGEFLPGSVLAPGSIPAKIASGVGAGLTSEGAGQVTAGTGYEPYARIGGALAGGIAPSVVGRTITPIPASPARQRLVDVLEGEGVTSLTAGQRTGNKSLQYLESASGSAPLAGGGAERITTEGQRQFTEAAMRRAGPGLPDATPEVLARNYTRLGQQFEDLSARNTLIPDNRMIVDITDAVRRYRNVPDSQQRAILQGYIDDIIPHINAGGMPGVEYQPMRSMLSADAKAVRQTDPYLSRALAGIRDALDNAMGRSISPADREAWNTARREYGAQKILEKTASRAGEATAEGQIVPANLRNTAAAENRGAYARGEGQFSELGRAGAGVMAPLPNSGTAQRSNAFNLLNNMTLGIVPAVTGRVVNSAPVQAYLGNQLLAPALRNNPTMEQALFQALMETSRRKISDQRGK